MDSTTVLHWLATFVRNRVKLIKELCNTTWRYVPTDFQNPSDLGTRGVSPANLGEGPEGAKWELGFAHFLAGKMGFHALGLGFINKKTIENGNGIKI